MSGNWRAGMIMLSGGKVEAKIVKDASAAGYASGRLLRCTCVIQTERKARKRGSKQERGKNKERKQRILKVLKYARTLSDLARRFVTSNMREIECRLVV